MSRIEKGPSHSVYIWAALFLLFCLMSASPKASAAKKAAPARKGASTAAAGAPYPQCRYQGKIVRWIPQEMSIRVYISHGTCLDGAGNDPENGGPLSNADNTAGWPDLVYGLIKQDGLSGLATAEGYSDQMSQAAADGINQWKRFQPEGLYSFELTNDPQEANVYFFWTNHFVNKLGLGLFANDIRGYTAKHLLPYQQVVGALNAGNTDLIIRSLRPVVVQLRTTDTNGGPMPPGKIVAAAAHEMGHVLGIDGHSSNPQDLMSVYYGHGVISPNDAATIRYMYHQTPELLP